MSSQGASLSFDDSGAVWTERARAAYLLTFGTSFVAALINLFLGLLVAWVLVRYKFPGKRLLDSLIDLPLALPTAVAGLVYSSLYVRNRLAGPVPRAARDQGGLHAARHRAGADLHRPAVRGAHRAAGARRPRPGDRGSRGSLGATRWQTFRSVILPTLYPALITGFALAFARCLGEYGSVVFVSGNMPFKTEIAPVLIVARLEEFAYGEATAIAVVLLVISFAMLVLINLLERWSTPSCRLSC